MVLLFFFLLFLIAGMVHICLGHFADGGLLLGLAALLGGILYFLGREAQKTKDFLVWLKEKKADIEKGWAYYQGQKVSPKTEVTQYQGCASLLIVTMRFRSRFLFCGRSNASPCAVFTLSTFLLGWWGFPFGFIFTPQAIYRNLRGGYRQTVGQMLSNLDAELAKLDPKRRQNAIKSMFAKAGA